jgi:hypothetical protein
MNMKLVYLKYKLSIFFFVFTVISFAQEPGMISINSKPSGAKVILNGKDTGRTAPFQRAMAPGKYNYQLIHDGFRDYNGEFQIRESDIQVINAELVPLFSIVKIITNPEGAEVSINGRKKGTTPLTLNDIPIGRHSIKITKNPYAAIDTTFSNEDGKYTELNFNLVSNLAILGILAYPDAEIFIDGKRVANRIYSGHLEEGSYVVRAEKDGFVPEEKTITISKGQDTNLQFELQKVKSKLSVTSEPTAAKVFIDDQLMGETPLVINSLDIGNYELKLTKDDYDVWIEKVEIESGDLINKIVTLKWGESVEVVSNPAGASLFVDGVQKGETPVYLTLKKGIYHFKLTKPGFEDYVSAIDISGSKKIEAVLKIKEFPFIVETYPPGAKVFVNGKLQGKTPINSAVNFGDVNIQIAKRGYKSIYDEYMVENVPLDLNYTLEFGKIRKKGIAVLYSALFPGAGQSYLSRKGSPYLLGVAAAGCLGGSFYFNQQAVSLYDEYLSEVSNIGLREQLKSDWQKNKVTSQNLLYGAIGIYSVNLLWVVLMPDDTKRIKELGFKTNYNNDLKTQEIGITFKF